MGFSLSCVHGLAGQLRSSRGVLALGFFLLTLKATFLDSPPETAGADILETCVYVLGDAEPISEKPRSRRALLRSKFAGSWSLVDIPPWLPYSAILVTEILESAREIIHAPAVPPQLSPVRPLQLAGISSAGSERQAPCGKLKATPDYGMLP